MGETNTTNLTLNYMNYLYEYIEKDTQYWCIGNHYAMVIISRVFIFVCLCGLVGNMVVMRFLFFHMKKTPFTVYFLNLAIADFFLLLFILVTLTRNILSREECFNCDEYALPRNIWIFVLLFWYLASMHVLTAMSMESCLSILFPIWYCCHRPKHLSCTVCGVLWALAALTVYFAFNSCNFPLHMICEIVLNGLSTMNFLIFCLLPFLSNLSLFIRLRCSSQRRNPGKLYVAVLLSVIFMFIFGLPLIILILLHNLIRPQHIIFIGYLLASLNSSINPVIYFLVGSCWKYRLQGSMKVALQRVFEEKVTSEKRSHVPGDAVVETTV